MSAFNGDRRYYEYIVVGCGGVGSAAMYWLSKRAGIGRQILFYLLIFADAAEV